MFVQNTACLLGGISMLGVVTGCGIYTAEDAAREFLPTFCEKVRSCSPEAFDLTYPGGIDACVERGVSAIPASDRDRRSACSASEIDECRADIEAQECSAVGSLPASCQGC